MISLTKIVLAAWCLAAAPSYAAAVKYRASQVSHNVWMYDYQLKTAATDSFDELTLYFDYNATNTLVASSVPPFWDALLIQPDPNIPADGFFDVLHLAGNFDGTYQFSIEALLKEGADPTVQLFDLLTSSTVTVVGSGLTTELSAVAVPAPVPVPEPNMAPYLLFVGLVALIRDAYTRRPGRRKGRSVFLRSLA